MLAKADVLGRICDDQEELLLRIELFQEYCERLGCWDSSKAFANEHTQCAYFNRENVQLNAQLYDDTVCEVTLMSGLSGAGKDTWVEQHADGRPVISLDIIRREMGIAPHKSQGKVVAKAKEIAKEHLRNKQDFIWNATNIGRDLRATVIELLLRYHARVRIVYVEVPYKDLLKQNKDRSDALPEAVLHKLIGKWSPPEVSEAHEASYF